MSERRGSKSAATRGSASSSSRKARYVSSRGGSWSRSMTSSPIARCCRAKTCLSTSVTGRGHHRRGLPPRRSRPSTARSPSTPVTVHIASRKRSWSLCDSNSSRLTRSRRSCTHAKYSANTKRVLGITYSYETAQSGSNSTGRAPPSPARRECQVQAVLQDVGDAGPEPENRVQDRVRPAQHLLADSFPARLALAEKGRPPAGHPAGNEGNRCRDEKPANVVHDGPRSRGAASPAWRGASRILTHAPAPWAAARLDGRLAGARRCADADRAGRTPSGLERRAGDRDVPHGGRGSGARRAVVPGIVQSVNPDGSLTTVRVTAIGRLVSARYVQGRRRAVALIPAGRSVRSAYGLRVRRYVYLHQDAMWIGLCAAVATGILIRLLSS